ncbi:MAG: hypothetical protein WBA57_25570 [Elainellaceae cyanobacterium]
MKNLKQQFSEQQDRVQRLEAELNDLQKMPEITVLKEDSPLEFLKQKLQVSKLSEERQQEIAQLQSQLNEARLSSEKMQHELERHRRASLMGFDRLKQAAQKANVLLNEAREAIEEIERLGIALSKDYEAIYGETPVNSTLEHDYFLKHFPDVVVGDRSVTLTTQAHRKSYPQSAA